MNKRNHLIKKLITGLLLFVLTGCGNVMPLNLPEASVQPPETSDAPSTEHPAAAHIPQPTPEADPNTWQGAYVTFMEGSEISDILFGEYKRGDERLTYSLIYVDEDDIPEVVIDSGGEAFGCLLLTWHEGKLDWLNTDRLEFTYLEKQNILCNGSGNSGSYYDRVYAIQDGSWTQIADGEFWETYYDEETANAYYAFSWNGEEVSEKEYLEQLNTLFHGQPGMEPEQYYILPDICSLLLTGEVSGGHSYEFINKDISWAEANSLCLEKGGHLATITSLEEFDRISSQIKDEGLTDLMFWVGACKPNPEKDYSYYWMEPGYEPYDITYYFNALYPLWCLWYKQNPEHYAELKEKNISLDAVCLFFDPEEEGFFLRGIPGDPMDWGIEYKGKIGYICEYDS